MDGSKNKAGLYIVDPERKGAAPSKPKDARDNSQKAYYTRKYMEFHAAEEKGPDEGHLIALSKATH